MDLDLGGKLAVVTGASKGIGRAVAESLAAEGCGLVLVGRGEGPLRQASAEIAERHGVEAVPFVADLSIEGDRAGLAAAHGDADILINNAGAIPAGEFHDVSDEVWRAAWELKVFGYIGLTRLFYAAMRGRRAGVIVNVIGVAGERLNPKYVAGTTGNASLIAFTRALGARSPDFGIRVLGVNPGLTATDRAVTMLQTYSRQKHGTPDRWMDVERDMNLPFDRMGRAEEVADMVTFLASARASYVSGTVVTVDGGAAHRDG